MYSNFHPILKILSLFLVLLANISFNNLQNIELDLLIQKCNFKEINYFYPHSP